MAEAKLKDVVDVNMTKETVKVTEADFGLPIIASTSWDVKSPDDIMGDIESSIKIIRAGSHQ